MTRYDLSETEWRLISPLLPNKPRGVARVDDRRVLSGINFVDRMGCDGGMSRENMARQRRSTIAGSGGATKASSSA